MTTKHIFLSYRRQDAPGYTGRIADHLEAAFGEIVFRDVDNIGGGSKWKSVLNTAVSEAKIVLAIIGSDWLKILAERTTASADYIRFELNLANMLDKPIIPVFINIPYLDSDSSLGDLAWLTELQGSALSDTQERFEHDMALLVSRITDLTGLQPIGTVGDGPTGSQQQSSSGDKSPNIISESGDVTINFGKD